MSNFIRPPFECIFPQKHNLKSTDILDILKDYVKVLETQNRQEIRLWKLKFLLKFHRNKCKVSDFKDGEIAYYIFDYLFKNAPLIYRNWFKENKTTNVEGFISRPDFKSSIAKKSFIQYFSSYEVEDLNDDIKIKL